MKIVKFTKLYKMDKYFLNVKNFLSELEYSITSENEEDGVFVIDKEEDGIKNLVLVCADPVLIIEQHLVKLTGDNMDMYKNVLKKNRDIIHGAMVLDEEGLNLIFRDTLQLENLDLNELEGSLNSLALLLSEYYDDLISYAS